MKSLDLNHCERNTLYCVKEIDCERAAVARRLTELGFVEGAQIMVIQFSALKKTLLVEIEGYVLSLRASVAQIVKVTK